jgi:hypothetical protein
MSAMGRRVASLLIALLLAASLVPAVALADGDPASDILLGQDVFYPYTPAVPGSVQTTLNGETAAARRAGLPIKVALIASPIDLGVIPQVFGKPQAYANFLDKEISFNGPQPLLVVMADGYGVAGVPAAASRAAATLKLPAGKTSTDLAQAAIAAVPKLTAATGHPIAGSGGAPSSGGNSPVIILVVVAIVAVLLAGAVLAFRWRHAAAGAAGR